MIEKRTIEKSGSVWVPRKVNGRQAYEDEALAMDSRIAWFRGVHPSEITNLRYTDQYAWKDCYDTYREGMACEEAARETDTPLLRGMTAFGGRLMGWVNRHDRPLMWVLVLSFCIAAWVWIGRQI